MTNPANRRMGVWFRSSMREPTRRRWRLWTVSVGLLSRPASVPCRRFSPSPVNTLTDALAAAVGDGYGEDGRNITLDYELCLEADPDVVFVLGPMTAYHDLEAVRTTLEDDAVASDLTAVKEGDIYA